MGTSTVYATAHLLIRAPYRTEHEKIPPTSHLSLLQTSCPIATGAPSSSAFKEHQPGWDRRTRVAAPSRISSGSGGSTMTPRALWANFAETIDQEALGARRSATFPRLLGRDLGPSRPPPVRAPTFGPSARGTRCG